MKKKRLLKLADFLETVPPRKFDLSTWVQSMPSKPEGKRPGDCGFAGCAIGWAVHAKLFRGFAFNSADIDQGNENPAPSYFGLYGFKAVEKLFDLSSEDAAHLFVDQEYLEFYATPKQVAKRIRDFVGIRP